MDHREFVTVVRDLPKGSLVALEPGKYREDRQPLYAWMAYFREHGIYPNFTRRFFAAGGNFSVLPGQALTVPARWPDEFDHHWTRERSERAAARIAAMAGGGKSSGAGRQDAEVKPVSDAAALPF